MIFAGFEPPAGMLVGPGHTREFIGWLGLLRGLSELMETHSDERQEQLPPARPACGE